MEIMTMNKTTKHFIIGLLIRLILLIVLPALMDDGLLLPGVRYTDIDYDVFTDAATHIAEGRSPYRRHTYRYTPFLAALLSLPIAGGQRTSSSSAADVMTAVLSTKYFGKILFCVADAICGYIILILRARSRRNNQTIVTMEQQQQQQQGNTTNNIKEMQQQTNKQQQNSIIKNPSPEFMDALWWLYNPLPINICTRGSAEALVVLLPVLVTVALTTATANNNDEMKQQQQQQQQHSSSSFLQKKLTSTNNIPIPLRACLAGILHGIGIHCKLYPVIYTVSFMANFSRQEQHQQQQQQQQQHVVEKEEGWTYTLSEQMMYFPNCMCCTTTPQGDGGGFPWKHPMQIILLGLLWIQRLFVTPSSILFLTSSIITVVGTTYAAVYYYGYEALEEGLLYHFARMDHRHNYSMYWYWIYLLRGSVVVASGGVGASTWVGNVPLIPQILILGFSSLGIAPYDLTFALFCQTFCFVAFNKVMTAQYFTWYLCLLPLCSDRIQWSSRRMLLSLSLLLVSILTWLGSAFTLEMLGWRSHRQVWMASVLFFGANVNLLVAILNGYRVEKMMRRSLSLSTPGEGWATKLKAS